MFLSPPPLGALGGFPSTSTQPGLSRAAAGGLGTGPPGPGVQSWGRGHALLPLLLRGPEGLRSLGWRSLGWRRGSGWAHRAGQGSSLHFLWRSSGRPRGSQYLSSTGPACRSVQCTICLCNPGGHGGSAWAWRPGCPLPELPCGPTQGHTGSAGSSQSKASLPPLAVLPAFTSGPGAGAEYAGSGGTGGPAPRLPSWEALGSSLGLSEPLCLCNNNTCLPKPPGSEDTMGSCKSNPSRQDLPQSP